MSILNLINSFLKERIRRLKTDKFDYIRYWNHRYEEGGTSGNGSYGDLSIFKADIINSFIVEHKINSIIEFGCGDGNNLSLYNIKKYLGLDVSEKSILININKYKEDDTKSFILYNPQFFSNHNFITSELVICIDVLYHIVDDEDYFKTLFDIFSVSEKYVILYTSVDAFKKEPYLGGHVKHRNTVTDLRQYGHFKVIDVIGNPYSEKSSAVFIILERTSFYITDFVLKASSPY